jgi:thioesterase domain-containing protein
MEKLFVHHRPWVLRLQRLFGPLLPRPVFDNSWSRIGALQNLSPANYPGKVVLFRAADVPVLRGADETLGWSEIVDGGVEVVFVPGDHESMFRKPNVQFLSQRFRQALEVSES